MSDEEIPSVNTEEQRRALDVMSARLLDNLNSMIAEQEARVQEFSRQQSSLSPLPMPEMTPVVAPVPQQQVAPLQQTQAPVRTHPQTPVYKQAKPISAETYAKVERHTPAEPAPPPLHRSVTPPPISSQQQKKKAAEQPYRIPRPSLNRPAPAAKGDGKENSVGCGKIAVLVVIVIILLRACS